MTKKYPIVIIAVIVLIVGAFVLVEELRAAAFQLKDLFFSKPKENTVVHVETEQDQHNSIALGRKSLYNIGIDVSKPDEAYLAPKLSTYRKMVNVPAMVVDRPGRTQVFVPSPAEGTISRIYAEPGAILKPGDPLFDIRLNHEELIRCQSDLLALVRQKSILQSELDRISGVSAEIIPKARRDFELQMADVTQSIELQKKILNLHGLTEEQVQAMLDSQEIASRITIHVPDVHEEGVGNDGEIDTHKFLLQMEQLSVQKGQKVAIGDPLCQISDLSKLYIEGRVFAFDENVLHEALMNSHTADAVFEGHDQYKAVLNNLMIKSMDNRIDPNTRTLQFYVELDNELLGEHDHGCIHWKYKPGQRCELRIMHEEIPNCFILPREALAEDNIHAFVFEQTGTEEDKIIWTQREVRVLAKTRDEVAIANDGAIFPGTRIAKRGAAQLLVELNSGGGKLQSACPCGDH